MILLQLLLVTFVHDKSSTALEICNGTYCPPILAWPKFSLNLDEPAPIFLGRDEPSGCYCRESPRKYSICFGRKNCKSMPKQINITTAVLKIRSTQIVEFKSGDFEHLRHLQSLQVESNFVFERIQPGSFAHLVHLRNMSISYNGNLRVLQRHAFNGLANLRQLFLIKNAFESIYDVTLALSRASLPKLWDLSLNENTFIEIPEDSFGPMENSTLESLNLVLCRVEYLHPAAFGPLKNLQVLRIGENSFNTSIITDMINMTIKQQIPLKLLNLYSVGFRKTPPRSLLEVIAQSNISSLNLARNQFEVITAQSFPYMPRLQSLDLRDVLALNITNDAFSNLPNLRTLLLSGNKLATIPEGVLLENLSYLDLQQNSGNLFNPSYFTIFKKHFSKMRQLQYLDLSYNRLNGLYNTTFVGLTSLRILGLKNATLYYVTNDSFVMLKNLRFLNLENNYFVKSSPVGIDLDVFKGLDNLQILLLGGCSISFISQFGNPFGHLKALLHLGLERNKLLTLHPKDFATLSKLRSIDLSQNQLAPWQQRIFWNNTRLDTIVANNNKLGYFSLAMLEDFVNLTGLEVNDNPFTCDCASFTYAALSNPKLMELIAQNSDANCVFPDVYSNLSVVDYFKSVRNKTIVCDDDISHKLILIVPLVFFLAILTVLLVFSYYYRWHIRYWIFLTRLYLSRKGRIRPKLGEKQSYTNYEYDAFVSYSNEDRNFVIRLVAMLENYEPYLKLCVYERDFQIGTVISESVLESVAKSRKTLLVISDNYAKSQWCRWESQIAEHHRLFFENENGEYVDDTLVLIKLGPVSEHHLTPTLKYLLKTRIYLQWEGEDKKQKIFWEKLRNTLAPPKHHQQQEYEENTHM